MGYNKEQDAIKKKAKAETSEYEKVMLSRKYKSISEEIINENNEWDKLMKGAKFLEGKEEWEAKVQTAKEAYIASCATDFRGAKLANCAGKKKAIKADLEILRKRATSGGGTLAGKLADAKYKVKEAQRRVDATPTESEGVMQNL